MAAGQGFKTFTTGEVLTAADVNGYLMQGVLVFASAAARDAAITSPQEGQFAFTKDTNGLWYYDGAAWVASGAAGDIEGVTAGVGISGGGTSGTVTVTNSMATAITTNGDLIYGTGSGTFTRRAIGTTGQIMTVAGGVPTWATPSGGGASYSLINPGGTSLSGSANVNISGISNKESLMIIVLNASTPSGSGGVFVKPNNDATNNVQSAHAWVGAYSGWNYYNVDAASSFYTTTIFELGTLAAANSAVLSGYCKIDGATSTDGWKVAMYGGGGTSNASGANQTNIHGGAVYAGAAITSISITSGSGNFDAGTVYVYATS
jgi:hypothetical protein